MLFLIGHERSILGIAKSRQAIWVALLLVVSAGFARQYDSPSLSSEPWSMLTPLAASTAGALVLFLLVTAVTRSRGLKNAPIAEEARAFFTLFWMTAPMAWFYGIPYEQFLTEGNAAKMNISTLAIVSAWRVLLMSRVISVLYRVHPAATFPLVMLFGEAAVLTILMFTPAPLLNLMGGVQLTAAEQVIQASVVVTTFWGAVTFPIWLLWALGAIVRLDPEWAVGEQRSMSDIRVSKGLWMLPTVSIVFWLTWLLVMQLT